MTEVSKIFFTSDTHFGHDRAFLWQPRGFTSSEEHDEKVIENWNAVVGENDLVYHLGDVMLGDNNHGIECLKKLNGTIYIIPGNHDTKTRLELYKTLPNVRVLESNFPDTVAAGIYLKYKKYQFYLSHHPTYTSNLEKEPHLRAHLLNLYGHTHQKEKFYNEIPFMFHVGMDSNNNTPVLIDDIIETMKEEVKKCLVFLSDAEVGQATEEPKSANLLNKIKNIFKRRK